MAYVVVGHRHPSPFVLHPREKRGRGMLFGIAYDRHPPSQSLHESPLGDSLDRVIRSLAVDVGADGADQLFGCSLVENRYQAYAPDGRDDLRALLFRHGRTRL